MDGLIQENATNKERKGIMNIINNETMMKIKGGSGVTAAMLNAVIITVSTMFAVGQAIGSAVRRAVRGNYC